jgi:hypothetical protein
MIKALAEITSASLVQYEVSLEGGCDSKMK